MRLEDLWWAEPHSAYVGNIRFDLPRHKNALTGKREYTKREALLQISKTTKGSRERSVMIQYMIDKGHVPVKSKCLYKLVKRTEEDRLPVGDEKWKVRGRPTKEAAAKEKRKDVATVNGTVIQDKLIFSGPTRNGPKKTVKIDWEHDRARGNLHDKRGWKASISFDRVLPASSAHWRGRGPLLCPNTGLLFPQNL